MKIINHGEGEKTLCLITGIHGNEASIFEPLKRFIKTLNVNVKIKLILANEEAAKRDIRFVEEDLNRAFRSLNNTLESNLARKLKKLCNADLVIDFHTHGGEEVFSLVSEQFFSYEIKNFINSLGFQNCIVMDPTVTNQGALIENVPNSVSIETGKHKSKEAFKVTKQSLLKAIDFMNNKCSSSETRILKSKYFLYNNQDTGIRVSPEIKNFKKIDSGTEVASGIVIESELIPTLVSYNVEPGKKIFLACEVQNENI